MLESPTHTTVINNMPSTDIKSDIEHHQDKPVLGKYRQIQTHKQSILTPVV